MTIIPDHPTQVALANPDFAILQSHDIHQVVPCARSRFSGPSENLSMEHLQWAMSLWDSEVTFKLFTLLATQSEKDICVPE